MNAALKEALDQANWWPRLKGLPLISLDTKEGRQAVADEISSALSPENLSCDGELSAAKVKVKLKNLTAAKEALLKLDPTVKFYE